jgi:signal transduction histidine kinase
MPPRNRSGNGEAGATGLGLGDVSGMVDTLLDRSRRHPNARLSSIAPPLEKLSAELSGDGIAASIEDLRSLIADIRKDTETAANAIMDACETMQEGKGDDVAVADIFTACGFQDIVGQRCTRALTLLDRIVDGADDAGCRSEEAAAGLLDGPAGGNDGPSQAEIDKLFSGVGDG